MQLPNRYCGGQAFYLPEQIPISDVMKAVTHLPGQTFDRILALDEVDMETAGKLMTDFAMAMCHQSSVLLGSQHPRIS